MLTPAFDITQDDRFITINVKAPFAKVSEVEIFIERNDFKFYSKPYYLRLTLPGNLVEDGRETAKYEAEKGVFIIRVPKETACEQFEGLDMITKLLTPKGQLSAKPPLIEVLDEASANGQTEDQIEDFNWMIEQTPYEEDVAGLDGPKYGFASQRSGVFSRLQSELGLIVDLEDPDTTPASERGKLRTAREDEKFDDDHYLADLYGDEVIQELLRYSPPWCEELQASFTDEEKEKLRKLPRKEYLLEEASLTGVYLGLIDILFAYCYNLRSGEGETTVESAWTLCKLSSTLSWLETCSSVKDVIVSCYRRCLCYPLYRHWNLTQAVFKDLIKLFSPEHREYLLKSLLEIHTTLQQSDPYYILNDLYITDYCVWIQSVSQKRLDSLGQALSKLEIKKVDVGFHLDELEAAAESLIMDSNLDTVSGNLSKMSLGPKSAENSVNTGTSSGILTVRDSDDDSTDTDDVSTIGNDETTESDDEASSSDYTSNLVNSRNSLRFIKEIHTQADV